MCGKKMGRNKTVRIHVSLEHHMLQHVRPIAGKDQKCAIQGNGAPCIESLGYHLARRHGATTVEKINVRVWCTPKPYTAQQTGYTNHKMKRLDYIIALALEMNKGEQSKKSVHGHEEK